MYTSSSYRHPLTMHERHSYRLVRDLFAHKEAIFGELKRASTLAHTPSGGGGSSARTRAISTDESNRRANTEARNRAIASKSRASSPAPHPNGRTHHRDRSSGPAETRFPIQTSPPSTSDGQRKAAVRHSLEVPSSQDSSPTIEKHSLSLNNIINNNQPSILENPPPPPPIPPQLTTPTSTLHFFPARMPPPPPLK